MSDTQAKESDIPGLAQAIERYGPPIERCFVQQVSEETFRYWESVRRKRNAEVVILLRRKNGRYLVHTKGFYPPGTYRLISGGIKPNEDLLDAVQRETHEETGLEVRIERFLGLLRYRFQWQAPDWIGGVGGLPPNETIGGLPFTSCLFAVAEQGGTLGLNDPGEAISGYREVSLQELGALAEQLEALPPEWNDWGRFRAMAHRFILEVLDEGYDSSLA